MELSGALLPFERAFILAVSESGKFRFFFREKWLFNDAADDGIVGAKPPACSTFRDGVGTSVSLSDPTNYLTDGFDPQVHLSKAPGGGGGGGG